MEKYPIPFQHPAEAIILNGIGPTLIQKLERKLKQHCEENRQSMPLRPGSVRCNNTGFIIIFIRNFV